MIADETVLSNKEARAYLAWQSSGDAEQVASELDVSESTAWSYKYRINDKLQTAACTASLKHHDETGEWVPMTDPETALEKTFFNQNIRGNDRGASHDRALAMVNALMLQTWDDMTMQEIADELDRDVDRIDELLGEATVIVRRSEHTMDELSRVTS